MSVPARKRGSCKRILSIWGRMRVVRGVQSCVCRFGVLTDLVVCLHVLSRESESLMCTAGVLGDIDAVSGSARLALSQ